MAGQTKIRLLSGDLPEKYIYEFEMLLREYLPFAEFTREDPADLTIEILKDRARLLKEQLQLEERLDTSGGDLTGDPRKNRIKKALAVLMEKETGLSLPWGILTGVRPTKIAYQALENGMDEENIVGDLQKDFLLHEDKARLMTGIAGLERDLLRGHQGTDISLYVGIPFCPTRCSYCSFVSYDHKMYDQLSEQYLEALLTEIEESRPLVSGRRLQSFYMGGGTPTTLTAGQMDRLLTGIDACFPLASFSEVTIEAGRPDTITREKLEVLKAHGVNRISINPQSLNQKTLDLVGRHHTVEQIYEAFELSRSLGFDHINMDFILGLPGETAADVKRSMDQVLDLRPDNLTVHTLAIKRSSRINELGEGDELVRQGEQVSQMIDISRKTAQALGMQPYYMYRQKNMAGNFENVGYSLPGKECVYNIEIMEERQSILAFGAGSVSKIYHPAENRLERAANVKNVTEYIDRVHEMVERKRKELSQL